MFDLGSADAKGERTERAVSCRVAIAADDGHAWQRAALFGPDDVHDALPGVTHFVERDSKLGGVLAHDIELFG